MLQIRRNLSYQLPNKEDTVATWVYGIKALYEFKSHIIASLDGPSLSVVLNELCGQNLEILTWTTISQSILQSTISAQVKIPAVPKLAFQVKVYTMQFSCTKLFINVLAGPPREHLLGGTLYRSLDDYFVRHLERVRNSSRELAGEALLKFFVSQWERYRKVAMHINI